MQPECHGTTDSHADQASVVRGCTTATHKSCETIRRRCIYVQFLVYSMQLHDYTPDPKLHYTADQTKNRSMRSEWNIGGDTLGRASITAADTRRTIGGFVIGK